MGGLGIAAKIMSKYGYKDGQGLGKNKQGISTALVVEKTSRRGGIIINKDTAGTPPPEQPWAGAPPPPVGVAIPPPNLYDDLAAAPLWLPLLLLPLNPNPPSPT